MRCLGDEAGQRSQGSSTVFKEDQPWPGEGSPLSALHFEALRTHSWGQVPGERPEEGGGSPWLSGQCGDLACHPLAATQWTISPSWEPLLDDRHTLDPFQCQAHGQGVQMCALLNGIQF